MTKEVSRWADAAMFRAEEVDVVAGPQVYLLEMTSDPLGSIAALSAMYTGKVTRSKDDVTDEERAHHLREMQLTKLTTPLEAVKLHFMIEGVTRAFTHQLVRNRTSAYAQESMRFAVKEDMPVALPPSLAGTMSEVEVIQEWANKGSYTPGVDFDVHDPRITQEDLVRLPSKQLQRIIWDRQVAAIRMAYNTLVNSGMPAEDARGLAPTNVLTRINWVTDLRTLIDVLGVRLCTQAQFEWRLIATKIAEAISQAYKMDRRWLQHKNTIEYHPDTWPYGIEPDVAQARIEAEYTAIASLFRPICYKTGKCEFMSQADRECKIRDRVQANHAIGRPSSEWDKPSEPVHTMNLFEDGLKMRADWIDPIHPAEWMLDPGAAR